MRSKFSSLMSSSLPRSKSWMSWMRYVTKTNLNSSNHTAS
ncbi:Uncharacterised protein [Vibrio cholerae]|nr:Uncharacterised protein [Vibrio cholerae]